MVYINVASLNPIVLNCHKNSIDGEAFRLVIDPETKEVLEQPKDSDIDVSIAYSRVFGYLLNNKPLPTSMVAEWG